MWCAAHFDRNNSSTVDKQNEVSRVYSATCPIGNLGCHSWKYYRTQYNRIKNVLEISVYQTPDHNNLPVACLYISYSSV